MATPSSRVVEQLASLGMLARTEVVVILGLLLIAVLFLLLTGRIRLAGLFDDKSTGRFDPGRLQVLVSTGVMVVLLLVQFGSKSSQPKLTLPSSDLLYLLGGSQGVYLVRKYFQSFPKAKGE